MEVYYGKNYMRQILGEEFLVEDDIKSDIVGSAPEELNTFEEVAGAIQENSESIARLNEEAERISTGGAPLLLEIGKL